MAEAGPIEPVREALEKYRSGIRKDDFCKPGDGITLAGIANYMCGAEVYRNTVPQDIHPDPFWFEIKDYIQNVEQFLLNMNGIGDDRVRRTMLEHIQHLREAPNSDPGHPALDAFGFYGDDDTRQSADDDYLYEIMEEVLLVNHHHALQAARQLLLIWTLLHPEHNI